MLGIFVLGQGISTEGLKDAYVVLQRKTIYSLSLEDARYSVSCISSHNSILSIYTCLDVSLT